MLHWLFYILIIPVIFRSLKNYIWDNDDLPTIRSATNVPGHNPLTTSLHTPLVRNNLPIIRPSENTSEENLSVIRSATNVPTSRVRSIKPLNALNFLASRMGIK